MRNLSLKIISLVCGISLFLFVNYFFSSNDEGDRVVQLIAPVEVRNVPADKALIWPASKQVEITVQGSALFMSKVTLSPPVVKVTLPELVGDKYIAKLSADDVSLPATVRLLAIKPAELEFGLDQIVQRQVKVVVPQIGNLNEELKLTSIEISPSEIKISGPSRELKSVNQIETVPVNLNHVKGSIQTDLELRNPGILSELETKRITLKLNVEDALGELNLINIPVKLEINSDLTIPEAIKNQQRAVDIKINATKKVLKEIKALNVEPFIRIDNKEDLDQQLEVQLKIDQPVSNIQISPAKILLKADKNKTVHNGTEKNKTSAGKGSYNAKN